MASPLNLEVGLSSANSSAAQGGDVAYGDFFVGGGSKNTAPGWLWPIVLLVLGFLAWRLIKK